MPLHGDVRRIPYVRRRNTDMCQCRFVSGFTDLHGHNDMPRIPDVRRDANLCRNGHMSGSADV